MIDISVKNLRTEKPINPWDVIEINRFFKESKDGWDEIDETEYNERKLIKIM